jgi:hypothetical protein
MHTSDAYLSAVMSDNSIAKLILMHSSYKFADLVMRIRKRNLHTVWLSTDKGFG